MKRVAEIIIIISTLAAIGSTFLLYRTQTISPQPTATVQDEYDTKLKQASSTETTSSDTTTPLSTNEPSTEAPELEISKSITIETLPMSTQETETLVASIHSLTNLSRSQNNLPKYTLDTTLTHIATKRSKEMIHKDYFSHTSPSGCDVSCQIKNSGYVTMSWGENLALSNSYRTYTMPELAQSFTTDWLKSSAHRDNMLSRKFTHHGIGIASEGEKIIVTVVFAAQ